ncbi:MAG: chromate efflux transporter [Solirubrobacterales bacterium]
MDGSDPTSPTRTESEPVEAGQEDPAGAGDSRLSIFLRFLKIGLIAWGGPAAQTQILYRECVEEEKWVSSSSFRKTLAVYQVLPGPEVTELCIYFGRLRAGRLGGVLGGLGFLLPGFLMMLALSVAYVEFDLSERFGSFFGGMQAAVGGLVAMAVIRLGRRFLDDVPLFLIAGAAFGLTLGIVLSFVLVLLLAGLAYEVVRWTRGGDRDLVAVSPLVLVAIAATVGGATLLVEVFWEGLKAGLLTFGGAYTVVPFLQESVVGTKGWLTEAEFLDGLALGGILPAPLVIITTFAGYLTDGLAGALVMTFAIFLPAFLLPTFFHSQLVRISEHPRLESFLHGVTAGVVGLIAAVVVQIVDTSVTGLWTAVIAAVSFLILFRVESKLTIPVVVLGAGVAGSLIGVG